VGEDPRAGDIKEAKVALNTGTCERLLNFEISLFTGSKIGNRWPDIEMAVRQAFGQSVFLGGSSEFIEATTVDIVVKRIRRAIDEKDVHLIALGESQEIFGGLFTIPAERPDGQASTGVGWLFVEPTLPGLTRCRVVDGLMARMIEHLAALGFQQVEVAMGTREGAMALRRRYGFIHSPFGEEENRWIRTIE
jgi:hypothetical protein